MTAKTMDDGGGGGGEGALALVDDDVMFPIMALVDTPTLASMRLACRRLFSCIAAHESVWRSRSSSNCSGGGVTAGAFFSIRDGLLSLPLLHLSPAAAGDGFLGPDRSRFAVNCLAEAIEATMANLQRVMLPIFSCHGFMPSRVIDASSIPIKLRHLSGTASDLLPDLCVGQHICATFPVSGASDGHDEVARHAIVTDAEGMYHDGTHYANVLSVEANGHLVFSIAARFLEGSRAVYLVSVHRSGKLDNVAARARAWQWQQGSIYSSVAAHPGNRHVVWNEASFCLFCQTGAYFRPGAFPPLPPPPVADTPPQ